MPHRHPAGPGLSAVALLLALAFVWVLLPAPARGGDAPPPDAKGDGEAARPAAEPEKEAPSAEPGEEESAPAPPPEDAPPPPPADKDAEEPEAEPAEEDEPEAQTEPEGPVPPDAWTVRVFIGLAARDDFVRLWVDKMRGTPAPVDRTAANLDDYFARHSFAGAELRATLGPYFGGSFRGGILRASLLDTLHQNSDLLPLGSPPRVHESAPFDLGVEFGIGADVRVPILAPVHVGLLYDMAWGTAALEDETFFQLAVEGRMRYFSHLFLLTVDAPLAFEKPFPGCLRPTLGLGALIHRADADISSTDGTRDWDVTWTQHQGFLATLSLRLESGEGLYLFVRGEFVGRTGWSAGMGIRF